MRLTFSGDVDSGLTCHTRRAPGVAVPRKRALPVLTVAIHASGNATMATNAKRA